MNNPLKRLKSKKGVLLQNTLMLYLLTFSNYLLSLAVIPYETRVLGPEVYGILGVAMAIMAYFQLFIDFGFLMSATQDVALQRENPKELCRIFSSVTCAKLLLIAASALCLGVLCAVIPSWQGKLWLYFLFLLGTASNSLIPDYLYRGMEKMSAITVRTVCIKAFFTFSILVFMKKPEDVWMVPAFTAVGNVVAMAMCYIHLAKKFKIRFALVSIKEVFSTLKRSSVFFYSRIATTAYSSLNTIILDFITASGAATGFYTSANNLMNTGKNVLSPISDSMYPYMVKNRDFKLVKKVLLTLEPLIFLFCTACFIWAEELCILIFGAEYAPAGDVLRAMLPVGVVILPSYILGFPTMSAMGIAKHANYSVIFGSCLHFVNLLVLYLTGNINMVTLGAAMSVAEALILGYRVVAIWRNRGLLKKEEPQHG